MVAAVILMAACGKKGPPLLPDAGFPFRVSPAGVSWSGTAFQLNGGVVKIDKSSGTWEISGCHIYHAYYPPDRPPCEGCPVDYRLFAEAGPETVSGDRFSWRMSGKGEAGVHYFKIRLLGPEGEAGPFSDEAKVMISGHETH